MSIYRKSGERIFSRSATKKYEKENIADDIRELADMAAYNQRAYHECHSHPELSPAKKQEVCDDVTKTLERKTDLTIKIGRALSRLK